MAAGRGTGPGTPVPALTDDVVIQEPPTRSPRAWWGDAAGRALLIVSMLLAGMVAMMAGFTVQDRTAGGQVLSSVLLPVPMIAAITRRRWVRPRPPVSPAG